MKKLQISSKELEIKRLEEENNREGIIGQINEREGALKQINDSIEEQALLKTKAGNALNDLREESAVQDHKTTRMRQALNRISQTYTQLTCALEQLKMESQDLSRILNRADLIDEVKGDLERVNKSAIAMLTKNY